MAEELTAYREAVRADVAAAIAGALPAGGQPVTKHHHNTAASAALDAAVTAIAEKGPTWHKNGVKARESKKFRPGAAVAEGWLLLKSVGDPRGSNQFWTSEVTLSAPAAKPVRRAPATRPHMRV
jgi:hypothetical protein